MLLACICGGFRNLVCTASSFHLWPCQLLTVVRGRLQHCLAAGQCMQRLCLWLHVTASLPVSVHAASHAALLLLLLPPPLCPSLEHLYHSSSPVPFTALSSGLLPELQWTSHLVQSFSNPGSTSTSFSCPQSHLALDLCCCAEVVLVTVFWNLHFGIPCLCWC